MTVSPTLTLAEVAHVVAGVASGPEATRVRRVRPLDEAGPQDMGFLAARRYAKKLAASRAGSFLVSAELEYLLPEGSARVIVEHPHEALQRLLTHLHPDAPAPADVHPTAVLERGAVLEADVGIGPYAVIGAGALIGAGSRIGAHVVVGPNSRIGRNARIHPHVTLYEGTVLGDRVIVHAGACLGSDGFGYAPVDGAHAKIPHVGGCVVGDDVEIGANSCVDRGSLADTSIGAGAKLDNLVQVGHNVKVGPRTLMAALAGVAGSTRLGEGVWIGGQVGVINHLEVGDGARVAFGAILEKDVAAGETVSGHPARPHREELRTRAAATRVPRLIKRVSEIERSISGIGGDPED